MNYLLPGDIVNFKSDGHIWAVFRESARYNTFLLTERCNHYCLMCSQPPKSREDSWLLDIAKKAVETAAEICVFTNNNISIEKI